MKDDSVKKSGIVIISGGSGYLGSAIAQKLINCGFVVVSLDRTTKLNSSKNRTNKYHIKTNITVEKSVEKASHLILKKFGKVTALIHCASAPLVRKPLLMESFSEFNSQFSVNAIGAFNFFKYFNQILRDKAVIIGITSKAIEPGRKTSPVGSYIPSKYALKGLLRVLSDELQDKSVRVYAVAPAFMPGGLNSDIPKQAMELLTKKTSGKDITSPDEIASVVLDIILDKTKYKEGKSVSVPSGKITDL